MMRSLQCTLEQLPWNVRQQFEEWAVQQAGEPERACPVQPLACWLVGRLLVY